MASVAAQEVSMTTKISALEALGFLCEAIEREDKNIPKSVMDQILNTIVQGIAADRPNEMRRAAIDALSNSLTLAGENFNVEAERNHIMDSVRQAAESPDLMTREKSFQSLVKIAELYYPLLGTYIAAFFPMTTRAIQTDDPSARLQALAFWTTIFNVEENFDDAEPEYLKLGEKAFEVLLPFILETLSKQIECDDDDDDDEWGIAKSGFHCLQALSKVIKGKLFPSLLSFISQNVSSPHWRMREASLTAYGILVESTQSFSEKQQDEEARKTLETAIPFAINFILESLKNPNASVREAAAWDAGLIVSEFVHRLSLEMLSPILHMVVMDGGLLEDRSPRVGKMACAILSKFADSCLEDADEESNKISPFLQGLLPKLRTICAENNRIKIDAYEAIVSLIASSAKDSLPIILPVFHEALNRIQANIVAQTQEDLAPLMGLVHVCARRVPDEEIKPMAEPVIKLFLQALNIPNVSAAHEDAFHAIGLLASKIGKGFELYFPGLHPFLIASIERHDDRDVCSAAIGTLQDICDASLELGPKITQQQGDEYVQRFISILMSDAVERELKPQVFEAIGDFASAIGGTFERYLPMVMKIAADAGAVPIPDDDYEAVDFCRRLRISILYAYQGILFGLAENGRQQALLVCLQPGICDLILLIGKENTNLDPNDDQAVKVVNDCLGLIGDLAKYMGNSMIQFFQHPEVFQLVQTSLQNEKLKQVAIYQFKKKSKLVAGKKTKKKKTANWSVSSKVNSRSHLNLNCVV